MRKNCAGNIHNGFLDEVWLENSTMFDNQLPEFLHRRLRPPIDLASAQPRKEGVVWSLT